MEWVHSQHLNSKGKGKGSPEHLLTLQQSSGKRPRTTFGRSSHADVATLSQATAQLALETARQVRLLSSIGTVTVLIPRSAITDRMQEVESTQNPVIADIF